MFALYLLLAIIAIVVALHFLCAIMLGRVREEAFPYLESSESVIVSRDRWLTFRPKDGAVRGGVVFYPGGYVDVRAYARLFHLLAGRGYLCVLIPAPQNTPMIKRFAADDVIEHYHEIDQWCVAGHSQGGAAASLYVRDRIEQVPYNTKVVGIVFIGFFVFDRHSHAQRSLPCISIYGDRDGHVEKFEPNEKNLPAGAHVVCIEGGNHGQFAAYKFHFKDGTPSISREAQQDRAVDELDAFLSSTFTSDDDS